MSKTEIVSLSKEEISVKLNDFLGTEGLGFDKMTKEDLVKLYEYLSKLFRPLSEMSLRELFDEVTGGSGEKRVGSRILPRVRLRVRELLKERKEETKTTT